MYRGEGLNEYLSMLLQRGAVRFGDFELTSGKKSAYYVDVKLAYTDPSVLSSLASGLSSLVEGEMVAGVELGAIPLVVAVSLHRHLPFIMIRKEERMHGTGRNLEGTLSAGATVDIIEDVTTTGGSALKACGAIEKEGGSVKRVLTVVDRGEGAAEMLQERGLQLRPLIHAHELSAAMKKSVN